MKSTLKIILTALLLGGVVSCTKDTAEQSVELKAQEHCPIMGGEINKKLFVDHDGQRIYVCCPGCIKAVEDDFDGAVKKLAAKNEKPASLQTTCPVMEGNKINKQLFADVNGKRIYVCCSGCIGAIKESPDKYIKKMEDAGIVLERVPEEKEADMNK